MPRSTSLPQRAVFKGCRGMFHLVVALLALSALLMVASPAVNAQAVTSVEIGSGVLDRSNAAGPRRERFGFDSLVTGTHVVRVTWSGDADVRFSLFEAAGTAPFARPSDSVDGVWTGTLDGAGQYAMNVWAVSGSANYTATIEATTTDVEITAQPVDLSVTDGDDAVFSVMASGSGTLQYQWLASTTTTPEGNANTVTIGPATEIPGATGDTLTISPGTLADDGTRYFVEITDGSGAMLVSDSATLTVDAAATTASVTAQPMDATIIAGENASFSVTATGSGTLGYQWFVNGAAIIDGTTDTLLLSAVPSDRDGDVYRVEITDDSGMIGSNDAILTVDGVPGPVDIVGIGQGTLDSTRNAGPRWVRLDFDSLASALHTITVSWDSDADVRFRVLGSDRTAISPVIQGTSPGVWSGEFDADRQYYIALWSGSGVANYSATVEANVPVWLSRQPSALIVTEGEDATFTVEASGSGTLVYQWLADGSPLFGETADSLTVFSASLVDDGIGYSVEVGNGVETVTSDVATLTVNEPLVVGLFSEEADTSAWMLAGPAPTLDYDAGPDTDGWGEVLLRIGDVLLVGGDFTGIKPNRSGQVTDRPFLAALDAVTGQPVSTFQVPPEVDGVVRALAFSPSGNRVYVGGDFGLLALDAVTGDLDFAVSATDSVDAGRVFDIAVSQTQIYIGGDFNRVDDTYRGNIARLSLDGDLDASWRPKAVNGFENGRAAPVQSITLSPAGDVVYVGGNFGRIDSTPVERTPQDKGISMLALDASDGAVRPERFIPDVGNNRKAPTVHDIEVTEFYVIIAWGGPNILTFHSLSGEQLRQHNGKGDVQALQVVGDHVFVGHHGEYFGSSQSPIPPEAVESISPRILVPYKFHSFRIDDGSFEVEQTWKIAGIFGVWGIAVGEDSIWIAGQMFRAGLNDRAVEGLVRFPVQD